ncbi:Glycoside hydrolase, family 31 and P-type trefoil domain and Galactose mutarotase-like domain and Glycoside hydrolase, superfamily domain-containing protein [Strongyloides ratti]|uniref:Maltase n=1 Tax=Strongyloides ratti TaxID=34506 RepID=A0A090LND7_STRRB|nr:Glycoside hydrolase, family 31 and P-type trefoil domain and Galactose mutarotase-like domain and Glycoside hydrolase, superfamily domain-containing protein [Strongyloides ratti]CEF71380.1 Glycoside hydrolase, family 31 and P-type trefoil domain and Galactose mutarotase-like domain and Glycoside hydrolase, superfamily domain-containing protein [Strongyloides ratti]
MFTIFVSISFLISFVYPLNPISPEARIDCYPDPNSSAANCIARGCIWDNNYDDSHPTVPLCYYPQGTGYQIVSQTDSTATLKKSPTSIDNPFGKDFNDLEATFSKIDNIIKVSIKPIGVTRYIPPVQFSEEFVESNDRLSYSFTNDDKGIFNFKINRNSNHRTLFDTSIGGLLFSDQYIQLASYLPSTRLFGIGEHIHQTLHHDLTKYTTWPMLARDQPPNSKDPNQNNLYGVHPFYMVVEPDGKAHGVLFFNSNPQEITTGPAPHIVYRTIGGQIDIFFFPGPSPQEVIQQYVSFVGKPFLPAYWSFGYQLCRYGFKNLQEVKDVVNNMTSAGIPFDTIITDIDYMDRYKDFTIGENFSDLGTFADDIHKNNMRLTLIWDPAIEVDYDSFERGLKSGAKFIEWSDNSLIPTSIQKQYPLVKDTNIMLGVVWPDKHTAFPDFLDQTNKTRDWWIDEFKSFYSKVKFDGIWIDMNEPSSFGTNEDHPWYFDNNDHPNIISLKCLTSGYNKSLETPPYATQSVYQWGDNSYLSTKTLCMNGVTMNGKQNLYNTKNIYGWSETVATKHALHKSTGKRGTVISRSTFPSSGKYGGHWLGDNTARWEDLKTTIIGVQEFNMFGIPYVGSDVCGFNGETNEELCLRWQQAGSFHSFFRNHNSIGEPSQWPYIWDSVKAATKKANFFRYRHLPYLFTLHFEASRFGIPVIKPVFFDYVDDSNTFELNHQFLWGSAFMVAPVIESGVTSQLVYLPDSQDGWYSVYDYNYGTKMSSGFRTYPALLTYNTPTFVAGGYIIPRQAASTTTDVSRKNPTELLIAISSSSKNASGLIVWDDGETIMMDVNKHDYTELIFSFNMTEKESTITIRYNKFSISSSPMPLKSLEVFGLPYYPDLSNVQVNGKKVSIDKTQSVYSPFTEVLTLAATDYLADYTKLTFPIQIKWNHLSEYVSYKHI